MIIAIDANMAIGTNKSSTINLQKHAVATRGAVHSIDACRIRIGCKYLSYCFYCLFSGKGFQDLFQFGGAGMQALKRKMCKWCIDVAHQVVHFRTRLVEIQ